MAHRIIPLADVLGTHPLERPLEFRGATVWIRIRSAERLEDCRQFVMNYSERITDKYWKYLKHIEPISLKIYAAQERRIFRPRWMRDVCIEHLGDIVDMVGADNVIITI